MNKKNITTNKYYKYENPLNAPANYHLIDIFKALKFGRSAASQKYLDELINELEENENVKEEINNESCKYSIDNNIKQIITYLINIKNDFVNNNYIYFENIYTNEERNETFKLRIIEKITELDIIYKLYNE